MQLPRLLCHRFSATCRSPVLALQDTGDEGPSLTLTVSPVETLRAGGSRAAGAAG